jgi:uncharacterized membrane protein YphA (DoxX/SURF4 family)
MPRVETLLLTLLRVGIGWHFAYEGLVKLLDSYWSSAGYLRGADWVGADTFHWIASNPSVLKVVDALNVWGLLLIGAALMLGCLTRLAAILGVILLGLYYAARPSLFVQQPGVTEGSYLIVSKNIVELLALCVVAVRPASRLGLDRLLFSRRRHPAVKSAEGNVDYSYANDATRQGKLSRREVLASLTGLPFVGAFALAILKKHGYASQEETQLAARIDALSGPSVKPLDVEKLEDLKGELPKAKIGNVEFSRLILGGNLMNGFAHARDLIYVSNLIKAYHGEEKVFETFRLAEACGVNAILTNPILAPRIVAYWNRCGGKIKFIAQCKGKTREGLLDNIRYSLDNGACAAYIQGAAADTYVREKNFDWIAEALQLMRDAGIPAGIGGHYIKTIQGCVEAGLTPDFWMKTLHSHEYWSARLEDQHDNIWCEDPQQTIAFMEQLPQPWIAFKVLAAGSIHPKEGFRYAFENGADFACIGMYDFQVVEDVNIALDTLTKISNRKRPWRA